MNFMTKVGWCGMRNGRVNPVQPAHGPRRNRPSNGTFRHCRNGMWYGLTILPTCIVADSQCWFLERTDVRICAARAALRCRAAVPMQVIIQCPDNGVGSGRLQSCLAHMDDDIVQLALRRQLDGKPVECVCVPSQRCG